MIREAIAFAEKAHAGQFRKYNGGPYIEHPKAVMKTVALLPHSTLDMAAAAVLHDVVEDTEVTVPDILHHFGLQVAQLVWWLTAPTVQGNRKYRKAVEGVKLSLAPPDAQTIKYADILDNIKDINEKDPQFAKVYLEEKRRLILAMQNGYEPLRQRVWHALIGAENGR